MRPRYLLVTWLLLLLPLSSLAEQGDSLLSFAESLAAEGDHYRAITEYKRFLHDFPLAPQGNRVRLAIAHSLIAGQRWLQADQALEELFQAHPGTPEALVARRDYADSAFSRSDYNLARQRYRDLLQYAKSPQVEAHAHYRIGWTYLEENRLDLAWTSFSELDPDRAEELSAALDQYRQLPRKSPLLAGLFSGLLPGAGQAYTGRYRQGLLAFTLNAAFLYGALEAYENDNYTVAAILLFFETGWYTGNIYNAVNNAHKYNQRQQARHKGEMRQRFGLGLGWQNQQPLLLAQLRF